MNFTYHPLEWEQFVISKIGNSKYKRLKRKALDYATNIDYKKIIEDLINSL